MAVCGRSSSFFRSLFPAPFLEERPDVKVLSVFARSRSSASTSALSSATLAMILSTFSVFYLILGVYWSFSCRSMLYPEGLHPSASSTEILSSSSALNFPNVVRQRASAWGLCTEKVLRLRMRVSTATLAKVPLRHIVAVCASRSAKTPWGLSGNRKTSVLFNRPQEFVAIQTLPFSLILPGGDVLHVSAYQLVSGVEYPLCRTPISLQHSTYEQQFL